MKRLLFLACSAVLVALLLFSPGCDKERIVESTEYVHDIEYIESPPDTIFLIDTVRISDSVTIHATDTVHHYDTVTQVNTIHDTVYQTITVHDTVRTVVNHYDTTVIVDTVTVNQWQASEGLAITALQYNCDPLVMKFITSEFGLTDGWIYYLSSFQLDLTKQSSSVYDIYGYIDYWAADWSGYYPLEFYWRMTYTGGDPANVNNWRMSDPPSGAPGNQGPGLRMAPDAAKAESRLIK